MKLTLEGLKDPAAWQEKGFVDYASDEAQVSFPWSMIDKITPRPALEKAGDAKTLVAIPLAIAGWCRYLLGVDDQGNAFERSSDPMLAVLTEQLAGPGAVRATLRKYLGE